MNSEISIDAHVGEGSPVQLGGARDEGFRPWHFFVLVSILLATVAVVLARTTSPAHLIVLSVTIAAAGAAAAAFYRTLAPLVSPSSLAGAAPLNERTRVTLEREKSLVLRSIKELEFDRAMGKLSQKDFDEMSSRLRARAVSLMKQLDAKPTAYGLRIEQELASRLSALPRQAPGEVKERQAHACVSCGTPNDHDAVFCKRCGTRLQA